MTGLVIRRLVQIPLILLVIYTMTFSLAWIVPGNPLENPEGRRPPDEIMQAMLEQYKLDSYWSFYWDYLGKATSVSWVLGRNDRPFDLGPSLKHENWTVNEILAAGLPVSITVGLSAILLACVIGITAGVIGAVRPGTWADYATLIVALVGISLPTFVIGTALLVVFSVWLKVFPVGGWGGFAHVVLPSITLSLPFAAYIARLTRFGMVDQLESEYVRTARAKGLSEGRVLYGHVFRNAMLIVIAGFPAAFVGILFTGSVLIEVIFSLDGLGLLGFESAFNRDYPVMFGTLYFFSLLGLLLNLVGDITYTVVDPRIDFEARGA